MPSQKCTKICLKRIRSGGGVFTGAGWCRVAGSYEHNNEPSGSVNDLEFLDLLRKYQFLKEIPTQQNERTTTINFQGILEISHVSLLFL
jgi:hypothetical protein